MSQQEQQKLKEAFDGTLRYKISEAVTLRTTVIALQGEVKINPPRGRFDGRVRGPGAGIVVERHVSECHGGMQISYLVARQGPNGRIVESYFEYELAPLEEELAALAAAAVREEKEPTK